MKNAARSKLLDNLLVHIDELVFRTNDILKIALDLTSVTHEMCI